jgi:hypothetical protein
LRCDWDWTGPSRDVPRAPIREVVDIGAIFDLVDPDGIELEFNLSPVSAKQQLSNGSHR